MAEQGRLEGAGGEAENSVVVLTTPWGVEMYHLTPSQCATLCKFLKLLTLMSPTCSTRVTPGARAPLERKP